MENYLKSLKIHYNFVRFEYLSFILFFTVLLLVVGLNRKRAVYKNRIHSGSYGTLFFFVLQRFLGTCNKSIFEVMMEMAKINPILSFPYWSSPAVIVSNDYDVIKEILNSPDVWINRPKNILLDIRANGDQDRGIIASSGPVWKGTRRYAVKTMTLLGLGKKSNLEYTTNELKDLLHDTQSKIQSTNNFVPVRGLFTRATMNVIWRVVGGTRFLADDPEFLEIVEASDAITETNIFNMFFGDFLGLNIVSWAPGLAGLTKQFRAQKTLKKHFSNILQKRQKVLLDNKDESVEEDNFTDHFLRKMNSNNNSGEGKMDPIFNLENILVTLFDLFEAGVETTSTTLELAVQCLAFHPHVQKKMSAEIKNVIGENEPSFYTDRSDMPYTQAVISEVHRMGSMFPLNFRRSDCDCYLNDTFLKKGTAAIINLYSIHYDEKFWKDPYNFRPERFLTEEGQLDKSKLNRLVHFGGGKRACLGEAVASLSIFTFLVGMLQKYEVLKADPNEEFGMEINPTLTGRPKPVHVHFVSL